MSDTMVGKELVLTASPNGAVIKRSKPTLIQVGNRLVSSDGRIHPNLAAEHLLNTARKNWVTVADLSKIFCGGNSVDNKRRVRKSMCRIFLRLLSDGEFLVYETLKSGRINAVKLLDVQSDAEMRAAGPQVERMKRLNQISSAKYQKALEVMALRERL